MINESLKLPNGWTIRNRIVKAAMSEALADRFNNPSDGLIKLFERWSKGGAGLLITGNIAVDRWHLEHAGNVVLDECSSMERVTALASAAKSGGSLVLAQLSHAGRQTPAAINLHPLSISDIRLGLPGYGKPKAATDADLRNVVKQFVISASLAKEAGFNGVEIHAAHGYLLSSSLSPRINTRNDHWGGSLQNRARLLLSIIEEVRSEVGQSFIIATKLNSSDFQVGGFSHEDSIAVAKMLEKVGIDLLEVSGGNFESPVSYQYSVKKDLRATREAYFLDYAKDIKAAVSIPVMVTGGFRTASVMNDAIADKATDLIGMGRPFIINPEFPNKLLDGSLTTTPIIERDFPSASDLPRGAVLNWFCYQLALHGTEGDSNISIPVFDGHERYLKSMEALTDQLIKTRAQL